MYVGNKLGPCKGGLVRFCTEEMKRNKFLTFCEFLTKYFLDNDEKGCSLMKNVDKKIVKIFLKSQFKVV